jgi:hypothetical protein
MGNLIMKTQMKFQKILMLVTLIVAALSFVYALSFCGGTVYQYGTLYLKTTDTERVAGARALFLTSQSYCDILITLSIIFILVVVLNYVMASQSRRNYYLTNYISIILTIVYAVVLSILLIVFVSQTFSLFLAVDKEAAITRYERLNGEGSFKYSISNFILGYIMAVIIICDAVALVLNLIWKIKLMQGERKLLAQGFNKEVA